MRSDELPTTRACVSHAHVQLTGGPSHLAGNYNFFNFLTGALCLTLLDDDLLPFRCPPLAMLLSPWSSIGLRLPWPRFILSPHP